MLVGTVKIIAYGVEEAALAAACAAARGAIRIRPVVLRDASLVMTDAPGLEAKLAAKGRRAIEARLRALGMRLAGVESVPHDGDALTAALKRATGDMVLILTGSATSDLEDTAPAALRKAGGRVARFGMPVDPGNLLFHGDFGGRPVIGLPGCARSPAMNGADWVLERLACGLAVGDAEIAAMGVGGLLKEIPLRPQLLDRFGLSVEVTSPKDIETRVEVIRRRDAYENAHDGFMATWEAEDAELRAQILAARKALPGLATPNTVLHDCAALCIALGSDGLRGELTLLRAARAGTSPAGRCCGRSRSRCRPRLPAQHRPTRRRGRAGGRGG
jgi:hypothetical protein